MRLAKVVLALVPLALQAGCAYQDATVHPPAASAVTSGMRMWGSPSIVLVTPFIDERPDRSRCGLKKAFSKESARIHCSEPPAQWLADLIARELRTAGFRVYDKEPPVGEPVVRIDGFLSQLFIEPDVEAHYYVLYSTSHYIPEADIALRLVARGAHFEAERRLYFKGAGEYMGGGLESNFQLALDNSVRDSLRGVVSAIAELVNLAPRFEVYACSTTSQAPPPK